MAKAYSKEFRREVLSACDAGIGTREVALRFKVSESWVRRIKQERREFGKTAPLTTRNRTPEWAVYTDQIIEIFSARPDTTLRELKAELGTHLSTKTLCLACQRLKLTFKKKSSSRRSRSVAMSK
jgi:transposase